MDLTPLQDLIQSIQEQLDALREGQGSANEMLDDLSSRAHGPDPNLQARLYNLEGAVQHILDNLPSPQVHVPRAQVPPAQVPRAQVPPAQVPPAQTVPDVPTAPTEESEISSSSSGDEVSVLNRLRDMAQRAAAEEPPYISMPTARHVGPTFDELLMRALAPQYIPSTPTAMQPPPQLVSIQYRPRAAPGSAISTSPTLDFRPLASPPARVRTVPEPAIRRAQPPTRIPRRGGRAPSSTESMWTQPDYPPPPPPVPPPSVIPRVQPQPQPDARRRAARPTQLGDRPTRVSSCTSIVWLPPLIFWLQHGRPSTAPGAPGYRPGRQQPEPPQVVPPPPSVQFPIPQVTSVEQPPLPPVSLQRKYGYGGITIG